MDRLLFDGSDMASNTDGIIKLSDGAVLRLRILIVDVKETGFSPFGGVNLAVSTIGGIAVAQLPDELRKVVADRPLAPSELPRDGWDYVDVVEFSPAVAEEDFETTRGRFIVAVRAEPVMVVRNLNYKTLLGEPLYWASWVYKISWRPAKG